MCGYMNENKLTGLLRLRNACFIFGLSLLAEGVYCTYYSHSLLSGLFLSGGLFNSWLLLT